MRGTTAVIQLQGQFDHSTSQKFQSAIRDVFANNSMNEIEVDLGGVDYIDSSACGMLLFLGNKAGQSGKTVALVGAKGAVKNVLKIMNFERLFAIK
jgi:anti-anti-sigma factor